MYDYNVSPTNSKAKSQRACELIEKEYPTCIKRKPLIDVDGSVIQTYTISEKDIDVHNDYEIGAIYVKSEIKLNIQFKTI